MLEAIKALLRKVWEWIKKIFLRIVSFFVNIVGFFKDPSRIRKLEEDENRIAVSIKEKLDNGDYQVVNCLYDKQDATLVTPEEDCVVITSQELDAETQANFGNKEMLVLQ